MKRWLGTLAFLAMFPGITGAEEAGACRPDFLSGSRYSLPAPSPALSTADVNLDGYPDLVTTTFNNLSSIVVRLGDASGGFGPQIPRGTSNTATSSVVGTFTNDPQPDIVVTTYNGLSFLKGNGDGTFQGEVFLNVASLSQLQAADVDDDGNLDAVGIDSVGQWYVVLGNGDGTFQEPVITVPKVSPTSYAIGDVIGDDLADLVATSSNMVQVYPGLGNGQFGAPATTTAGFELRSIRLADLDGDGDLDVAAASGVYVAVLLGNGDGSFQAAVNYAGGPSPWYIAIGDFDGDGAADIAVANVAQFSGNIGSVVLLRNSGAGTFTTGPAYVGNSNPTDLLAADFGNDGTLDIASPSGNDRFVSVIRGAGDGTLVAARVSFTAAAPFAMAAGDFDEDGVADVVLDYGFTIQPYLASGGGYFAAGSSYDIPGNASFLTAGAFSGPHLDTAALIDFAGQVAVLPGHGDGTFGDATILSLPVSSSLLYARGITAGDFDADGVADFAAIGQDPFNNVGYLYVVLSHGDGTFGPGTETAIGHNPFALLAADFNGDGADELVVADEYPDYEVQILVNRGDGSFEAPVSQGVVFGGRSLAAADIRHSGHLDLIVGSTNGTVTIFPGLGDGSFGTPTIIGLGWPVLSVTAADFNGDGNMDLVTANSSANASVLFGLGNGTFQSPRDYLIGTPFAVLAGDFDGNGLQDAVFANNDPLYQGITTLMNGGLGARVEGVSAVVGTPAVLEARASGFGPLTYQWRKDGVPLSDGGTISGTTTATLMIDPVAFADADSHDVLVTDSCGPVTSNPATLSVEFADVPVSSPFHDDIIAIATAGITGGCGGGDYCPTSPVRRDQMAVFLLKSEHGSAYTPPACTGVFDDVPCPGPFTDWVEQLAAEGITGGCGTDIYCPDQSVTRAQMAIFLLKTSEGSGYTPPTATGIFGDVPVGSFAADFIEDLYNRGISGGCSVSPLLYCPTSAVLRQQMATFLVRTFFP